ncbi:MAG: thioredoxin family protein [Rhodospirillum sp.]|nr:thioredoxin family protein [Rhodospirillum sp.]MCF8491210.1 thioredoxin family protein [Rhodospirillum sp.]
MPGLETPGADLGALCPDFALPDPTGRVWTLSDLRGTNGLLVAFICNHCPYVKAMIDRFVADAKVLQGAGIGVVAIMPNDFTAYPADAPDRMADFARDHGFPFPYLVDESQAVAESFEAVCTPDFLGFDRYLTLKYRGRLDAGRKDPPPPDCPRELRDAMVAIARDPLTEPGTQHPSLGCSIKWKGEA